MRDNYDLDNPEFRMLCRKAREGDVEAQYQMGLYLVHAGKEEEGLEALQMAVDRGSVNANLTLAEYLQEQAFLNIKPGIGQAERLRRDEKLVRAFKYLEAAAGEHLQAKQGLANCYAKGLGIKANPQEAERLLIECAKSGDGEAKLELARRYKYGDMVPRSFGRAMNWLGHAMEAGCENAFDRYYAEELEAERLRKQLEEDLARAETGDVEAILLMAKRYEDGRDVKQNDETAGEWYRKAAELGNVEAQYRLGLREDITERLEWMQKAAEQDYVPAQLYLANQLDGEENYAEAAVWYRRAAELGSAEAQDQIGLYCYDGKGMEKDLEAAAGWFRKAAEQNDALAQYRMGQCYRFGYGVDQNEETALVWYHRAAEQEQVSACRVLGNHYDRLPLPERDYSTAATWYHKAAEQGDAESQFMLGIYYMNGYGVDPDENSAAGWYERAAEQGHAGAQNNLGVCYIDGTGKKKDASIAMKWYQRSAEQGNIPAKGNLAWGYYSGEGVEKNYEKAAALYREGAEQGRKLAQFGLGRCYQNGHGVEKNLLNAVMWYQKAAEQGHESSANRLKESWAKPYCGVALDDPAALCTLAERLKCGWTGEDGNKEAADETSALHCFLAAAKQGYAEAQYQMGEHYRQGKVVKGDPTKAFAWYQKAAEQGYAPAQYCLGECFRSGNGTAGSSIEAVKWYSESAAQGNPDAQFRLAECYYKSFGVKKDSQTAWEWANRAAEQGQQDAMKLLAKWYEEGFGVEKSLSKADAWNLEAGNLPEKIRNMIMGAKSEFAEAQYELSCRYKAEPEVSLRWLKKAAEGGFHRALRELGESELAGKNYEAAREYLRKSGMENADLYVDAEKGDAQAQFFYAEKVGNAAEKEKYYRKAAAQGHPEAKKWVKAKEREQEEQARREAKRQAMKKTLEDRKSKRVKRRSLLSGLFIGLVLVQVALLLMRVFGVYYAASFSAMVAIQLLVPVFYVAAYTSGAGKKRLGKFATVFVIALGVTALCMLFWTVRGRSWWSLIAVAVSVLELIFWIPKRKKLDEGPFSKRFEPFGKVYRVVLGLTALNILYLIAVNMRWAISSPEMIVAFISNPETVVRFLIRLALAVSLTIVCFRLPKEKKLDAEEEALDAQKKTSYSYRRFR